jgi:hypothetical protein
VTLLQDELASVHAQLKGVEWPAKPQMTESLRQMEICVNAISTCAKHQKVITGTPAPYAPLYPPPPNTHRVCGVRVRCVRCVRSCVRVRCVRSCVCGGV